MTTTEDVTQEPAAAAPTGAFVDSLKRSNKSIRDDRAEAIVEAAEMHYRRAAEDLRLEVTQTKRDRDNMLDLSPTHADSLVLATDFDAKAYAEKEIALSVKIRNLEIELELATNRYEHLFGRTL